MFGDAFTCDIDLV